MNEGTGLCKSRGKNPPDEKGKRMVKRGIGEKVRHQHAFYGPYRTRVAENESGYICQSVPGTGSGCRRAALGHDAAFGGSDSRFVEAAGKKDSDSYAMYIRIVKSVADIMGGYEKQEPGGGPEDQDVGIRQ